METAFDEDDNVVDDDYTDFGETDRTALFASGRISTLLDGENEVIGKIHAVGDADWYRSWLDFRNKYTVTVVQEEDQGCLRVRPLGNGGVHDLVVEGGPTCVHKTTDAERCEISPSRQSQYNVQNRQTEYTVTVSESS